MFNKKAIGIKWYIAIFAFMLGFAALHFTNASTSIPKIGEYSMAAIESLEKGVNIPVSVEIIMKQLNKEANMGYDGTIPLLPHPVFSLKSYCKDDNDADTSYKKELISSNKNFVDVDGKLLIEGKTRNCYVDEDDLMIYYSEEFDRQYSDFVEFVDPGNFNSVFDGITYTSTLTKEGDKYFNFVETSDNFVTPINMKKDRKEKQIGEFTMSPDFKLVTENPVQYSFDTTEVCILSRDCGATCQDVINKYDSIPRDNLEYEIIDDGIISEDQCERYYNCETPRDDFGNTFSCDIGVLCLGQCLPFCSVRDNIFVSDNDIGQSDSSLTDCVEFSCNSYMDCSETGLCGCPDPTAGIFDDACIGNDCETLHCSRDDEFESKERVKTECRTEVCNYYDQLGGYSCNPTDFCQCDFGKTACEGDCTCIEEFTNVKCGCGDSDEVVVTFPHGCAASSYKFCEAGCNSDCDVCGCSYGSDCGPCGWDECPPPPEEEEEGGEEDDEGEEDEGGGGIGPPDDEVMT